MKTAICHDYFNKRGGGERTVMTMARALDADIITGCVDWKNTYEELKGFRVKALCKSINQLKIARAFEKYDFSEYDIIICSGSWVISSSKNHPSMWYCYTPARWLYNIIDPSLMIDSTSDNILKKTLAKTMIKMFSRYWKKKDQQYVKRFDKIVCISKIVKERIKKFYGNSIYKRTDIIYPPVFINKFRWIKQDDFYLSTARLDKLKRVDIVVKAFQKMPDKKLVVASGGPELESIKKLSGGFDNIEVLGWVSEKQLQKLMGSCIASIYVPINEDFGISPVESMAAEKPCIGVDEGGLKETIIHKKTGFLCKSATEREIIDAVNYITPAKALKMKNNCTKQAKLFSEKEFTKQIRKAVRELA